METGPGILWTVMPMELVSDGLVQCAPVMEISVEGRTLEVLPLGDGTGTIQRLISADPNDYLNPDWQPGARVACNSPNG